MRMLFGSDVCLGSDSNWALPSGGVGTHTSLD
jgi:hypothetical protein